MRSVASVIPGLLAAIGLTACQGSRMDPCEFLSVEAVRSIDASVSSPLWAGRQEPKADYEVCTFYNAGGDPRVMLFVWYDDEASPRDLVADGSDDASVRPITESDIEAYASFDDESLQLLAARSSSRTVGLRVRNTVVDGSEEFRKVIALAETAVRY